MNTLDHTSKDDIDELKGIIEYAITFHDTNDGISEEDVYIAYGDSNIKYVLEKINKKAKSEGLNALIKNINKGFFHE